MGFRFSSLVVALMIGFAGRTAPGVEPGPELLLEVATVHPEVQLHQLLALFQGTRAPHPAAALAAWKHATGGSQGLGKMQEALLAALNPEMEEELQFFDNARLSVAVEPGVSTRRWRLHVPGDDGRFGGLVRAVALTDGAILESGGNRPIYRIGPEGSAVGSGPPTGFSLASDLETLATSLPSRLTIDDPAPGWYVRLDPRGLLASADLRSRQAGEAFVALGVDTVDGRLRLAGDVLTLDIETHHAPRVATGRIEPAWLDVLPRRPRLVVFAAAFEPGPSSIAEIFKVVDRVERLEPGRAEVAPLRIRLNLLAAAARVNLEADLWSTLRGISGCVGFDAAGRPASALFGLHMRSAADASRLAERTLPRLATASLGMKPGGPGVADLDLVRQRGLPIQVVARGSSAWLAWGEEVPEEPTQPRPADDDQTYSRMLGREPAQRFGLFWPASFVAEGTMLATSLRESPPVSWSGRTSGVTTRDTFRWEGLRSAIRRGLEAIPLEPPPDRAEN